jgi:Trypsin-co-occurring domain 1
MNANNKIVETTLENGVALYIEATPLGGEQLIGTGLPHSFQEVTNVIEGLSESLITTLKKVQPRKASVEFGLEIGIESGTLTSLLVKGSGDANLKITLEWGE